MSLTLTSIRCAKKETKDRMGDSTKTKKKRIGIFNKAAQFLPYTLGIFVQLLSERCLLTINKQIIIIHINNNTQKVVHENKNTTALSR